MAVQLDPRTEKQQGDSPRVLVVEDDPQIAEFIEDYLQQSMDCQVLRAASGQEAMQLDRQHPAQLILMDYLLPDTNGLALLKSLNADQQRPTIIITGHATLGRAMQAMRLGARDMLLKPFDLERLGQSVSKALEHYQSHRRRQRRVDRVRQLSKAVLKDRRQLRRKMELVCRDLVHAYERLAHRVADMKSPGDAHGRPSDN